MALIDDLKQYAKHQGIDLLGCTSASPLLVKWQNRPVEMNPRSILSEAETIVIAACYVYGYEKNERSITGVPRGRFGPWTRAAKPVVDYSQTVIGDFLKRRGFKAVSTNELPNKMAAVRSGIAYYGKNCIVHAEGFGSYLGLSGIITDAVLDYEDRSIESSDCGDCNECIEACPTGALKDPYHLDIEKCICHWLWGSDMPRGMTIPRDSREKVKNYIFRCGFCQEVCPKNQELQPREEFPFTIEANTDCPELMPLLLGDDEYYRKTLPEFVMEAGIDTIRHNVAIALGNSGDQSAVPPLIKTLDVSRARIRAAAAWALGKLGGPTAMDALRKAQMKEKQNQVREEIEEALDIL